MPYFPALQDQVKSLLQWADLRREQGADPAKEIEKLSRAAQRLQKQLIRAKGDRALAEAEPDGLAAIRALRPPGLRRLVERIDEPVLREKIGGALLARVAGNVLGAIVEGWPVEEMRKWAEYLGQAFPPTQYWMAAARPHVHRYKTSRCEDYTLPKMKAAPADDDIAYTLLGLLILEEYGPDFPTADVAAAWLKRLPLAATAEKVALENLRAGVSWKRCAEINNPFQEWIGADIRSDPWGYAAAGWPEKAAEMAYRDAYISHRRNGIYGEMFFSAAIAAAFVVDDPAEAYRIALTEIPKDCRLANDVRWALGRAPKIRDWQEARAAVDKRFAGMSGVHTNNNAALTIFGTILGRGDVTKTIGETVAMGLDNDCTAATAGSIVGAMVGRSQVPKQWVRPLNDTMITYLSHDPRWRITHTVERFVRVASRVAG
ncbi:MAG: ADP-ribosylglycohydrolase family protein [Candidatus Sumerlaeota bacterium]|nr:ADP-ribosylglycohydrolase family protein [Candidatus Sumerlaeota bacterium]